MILLDHIDAIGRRLQRAVLYLEFHPLDIARCAAYRFDQDAGRDHILKWLDMQNIAWQACGPIASINGIAPYRGQVYLDVRYDETVPAYRLLRETLEHPDGTMKYAWVRFMVVPLEYAMHNAAHDVPGFWEDWAADF